MNNKKNLIIIELNESKNIDKDIRNNYCLPRKIYNFSKENEFKNIFNVYRIKKDFNFIKDDNVIFGFSIDNYEQYFREFLK